MRSPDVRWTAFSGRFIEGELEPADKEDTQCLVTKNSTR